MGPNDFQQYALRVKAADAARRFLSTAPGAGEKPYKQMLSNFPSKAIKWMKGIKWVGPVDVPLELVDFDSEDEWAASHQVAHVQQFMRDIRAGKRPRPAVGVVKPGHNRIRIVDGHHRTMAYRKLKKPARVYVGFVKEVKGPWDKTYLYQHHHGSDPKNKTAGVGKFPKAIVNYRPADTAGRQCGTCIMFSNSSCTLVAGDIRADHVCDRWEPSREQD